jgi:hypothetical protein
MCTCGLRRTGDLCLASTRAHSCGILNAASRIVKVKESTKSSIAVLKRCDSVLGCQHLHGLAGSGETETSEAISSRLLFFGSIPTMRATKICTASNPRQIALSAEIRESTRSIGQLLLFPD